MKRSQFCIIRKFSHRVSFSISRLIVKKSPTEICQKLCFQSKILYRISFQWILGFISSFPQLRGLSVKYHPPRGYENEAILSENMMKYRYQWLFIVILLVKIVLSPAVSKSKKNRYLQQKAHVILSIPRNFHRKNGYVSEILRFEGFRGHPCFGPWYLLVIQLTAIFLK